MSDEGEPKQDDDASQANVFPMDAKVILHGLTKGPQFNGKQGIVKSSLKEDGRQEILVGKKILGLKPSNLKYETRPIDNLSLQELKRILKENDESTNFAGMDVSDLRTQVKLMDEEKAFELLAHGNAKAAIERAKEAEKAAKESKMKSRGNQNAATMPGQAAAQQAQPRSIADMSPDQILLQAQTMRSMDKDQLRQLNPQMANFSDAMIEASINQMEQMAMNPSMMEMVKEQMKGMSPEDVERIRQGMPPSGEAGSGAANVFAAPNAAGSSPPVNPSNMLENMTGKQLKEIMKMMKEKPDMLQSMLPPGTSLSALKSSLSMFEGMNEEQLDSTLKTMKKFQKYLDPFRKAYSSANAMCGGYLLTVLLVSGLLLFTYGILLFAMRGQTPAPQADFAESAAAQESAIDEEPEF